MKKTQTIDLTIALQERKHLMNILCVCVCLTNEFWIGFGCN